MNKKIILQMLSILILLLFVIGCVPKPDQNNLVEDKQATNENQNTQPNEDESNANIETPIKNVIEEQSTLHTVKGKSGGVLPYAPVDASKDVTRIIDKNGGVVSTELINGMKIYVVIPEENIIQSATVSILPYKEMPSGQKHFALSDEFGYGAQIIIDSVQRGIKAYVVFDTKGNAAKSKTLYDRCDYTKKWFNPIICGNKNKVNKIIDKEYAVVSPIFNNVNLVLPRNTIPTRIDGLIVAEVENGDVYIPQKLDKALAKNYVKEIGKFGNAAENLEAAALALEWSITLDYSQLDRLVDSVNDATESYTQYRKAILVGNELYSKYSVSAALSEENAFIISDLKNAVDDTKDTFFSDLNGDSSELADSSIVAGANTVSELNNAGAVDSSNVADVENSLADGIQENSGNNAMADNVVDGGESLNDLNPSKVNDVKQNLQEGINNVLNNPSSSIESMLQAAALAQALGLDDLADKLIDKIKQKLNDMLGDPNSSKGGLYNLAALAQAVGSDDIADLALDKASKLKDTVCDNLVKKSLANYGINECN